MQRRAALPVCAHHVRVQEQQQPQRVREALVRRPVQRRAAVGVQDLHVRGPAHGKVVEHGRVPVLRRHVRGRVAAAVRAVQARDGAQQLRPAPARDVAADAPVPQLAAARLDDAEEPDDWETLA